MNVNNKESFNNTDEYAYQSKINDLEKQVEELKLNVIINEHDDLIDPTRLEFNQKQESFYLEACLVLIDMLNAYESVK